MLQALTKRNPQSSNTGAEGQQGTGSTAGGNCGIEHMLTSSLRRRPSSPSLDRSQQQKDLAKQVALTKLLGEYYLFFIMSNTCFCINCVF